MHTVRLHYHLLASEQRDSFVIPILLANSPFLSRVKINGLSLSRKFFLLHVQINMHHGLHNTSKFPLTLSRPWCVKGRGKIQPLGQIIIDKCQTQLYPKAILNKKKSRPDFYPRTHTNIKLNHKGILNINKKTRPIKFLFPSPHHICLLTQQ